MGEIERKAWGREVYPDSLSIAKAYREAPVGQQKNSRKAVFYSFLFKYLA